MVQAAIVLQRKNKFIKEKRGQVILRRPAITFYYEGGKLKSNRLFRFTKEKTAYEYFHTYLQRYMQSQHTTLHFTQKV